jgi:putative ABC transport system permease protein
MVPIRYNVRSLLVRKVTTLATAGGIALVVFVFAAALMLGEGAERAMTSSGRDDTVVLVRKGADAELSSLLGSKYKEVSGRPEVAQVGGSGVIGEIVTIVTAELAEFPGSFSNMLVRGTPAEGMAFRPEIKIVRGRAPKPGTNEAMVGRAISGRFKGVALGQRLELARNRPLEVVGEFSAGGSSYESELWGDVDVVRRYLGRETLVSSARVRLTSPASFKDFKTAVENDKSLQDVKAMRERDYYEEQSEGTAGFLTFMGAFFAVLFSIAAMIGAAITMNGAVANRSKEIGTLRALGFSRASILLSFLLESVFLAVLGGAVGLVFVMLLTMVSFPVMNFQTFSEITIGFQATPGIIAVSLIFSAGMGLLGGMVPAIRASRVSPVEAMRA